MMNGKRTEVAMLNMGNLRRKGLIWVLLCIGAGALWGTVNAVIEGGWIDFRALYASDRCLIHHQNPYNPDNVEREYQSEDGQRPKTTSMTYVSITRNANLPTTYVLVAPIAILPWGPAHILWMLLTGCVFFLANVLMWDIGADYAPRMATFLACVIGFNCLPVFSSGNTAGFAVGFCGIAVWCFLKDRFVWIGVLCLAFSLAFKPHDSGFVWLYFLLAGGAFRKRAVQTAAITAVIGLASILWFTHVAPGWMHDWKANLAVLSAPGGINDPGPNGIQIRDGLTYSFVSMQGAISMFRDDPHFYNILSCAICGVFLFVWAIWTLRTRFSLPGAWLALASVTAFTLLITYHRFYDARLMMLAIPACCMLYARGDSLGKAAALITTVAAFATGEIMLVIFEAIVCSFPFNVNGMVTKAITVVLLRPTPFTLLAMGVFYLWVYLRRIPAQQSGIIHTRLEAEVAT